MVIEVTCENFTFDYELQMGPNLLDYQLSLGTIDFDYRLSLGTVYFDFHFQIPVRLLISIILISALTAHAGIRTRILSRIIILHLEHSHPDFFRPYHSVLTLTPCNLFREYGP